MPTASPLQQAWGRSLGGVVCLPFGLRHTMLFFPVSLCGFTAIPRGLCRGRGWPGVRVLQLCCFLTPCAPCPPWGMEVCVSWTSSGNKVRRYALCHPCTCWRGMEIPGEAAETAEGVCCFRGEKLTQAFSRPKWVPEIFLLENNGEGTALTACSSGLFTVSEMLSYSTGMWVCIPLPK